MKYETKRLRRILFVVRADAAKNPITQCAPQFESCAPPKLSFDDRSAVGGCVLKKVLKMFWSYDKVNHSKDETTVFQEEDMYISVCLGFETTRFLSF